MNSEAGFKVGMVIGFIAACTVMVGCSLTIPKTTRVDRIELEIEVEGKIYHGFATLSKEKNPIDRNRGD